LFFFEKKNQKTFPVGRAFGIAAQNKSLFASFSSEKEVLLLGVV